MRRILVLRGGALGDFIVTLPALALLRQHSPDARIELVGNATAAGLAVAEGLVDAVHSQDEARWGALFSSAPLNPELRQWLDSFDLILSYWPDPEHELARRFPTRPGQQFLNAAAMPEQTPAAAHYCAPLRSLGMEPTRYWYPLRLDRHPKVPRGIDADRPIAVHPGSGSPRKNWPEEHWRELIAVVPNRVRIIIGEAERETWATRPLSMNASLATNLTLPALVAELASCALFLGHDSGVSHLAAACGIPCVLLFGPTDPAMWAPPAPHVRVIRRGSTMDSIPMSDVQREIQGLLHS